MGDTNSCSKATWELQAAFLKPPESVHRFPGGFRNVICCSCAALGQPLHTTARGFRDIYEIPKYLARDKRKFVRSITYEKCTDSVNQTQNII